MESYRGENRRLVATDSVRILRKDLAALAGLAVFSPAGDSMLLRAGPVVWYEENQVTGDSINMYLASHQLRRVLVVGDAFAASRTDTLGYVRFDQLSGATMNMWFEDRGLREVELDGRARSLYHLFEDSLANGMNRTSGDRITMRFTDGKVSSISVAGGVEGQYLPENLISGREGAFHLPGFLWRDDRPSLQPADRQKMSITTSR